MLFVGGSDSSISRWDLKKRVCEDRMTLEQHKKAPTLVWVLRDIGSGLIASGDSLGLVQVWDAKTCTLVSRFAEHQADVLSLCWIPSQQRFASGSVDSKISFFSVSQGKVAFTNAAMNHSHDVRALAANGAGLVSSGIDGELHFHLSGSEKKYFERASPYP